MRVVVAAEVLAMGLLLALVMGGMLLRLLRGLVEVEPGELLCLLMAPDELRLELEELRDRAM